MINHALNLLEAELESYMENVLDTNPDGGSYIVQGNVAQIDVENATALERKVVLSVVNIEEESAFKNLPNYNKMANGSVRYQNPPVFLNLYVLFAANFPPGSYSVSWERLSAVLRFFQGRNVFNLKNAPSFDDKNDPDISEMQIILDLYTMTFEQINHLWGSLGGKQMPFAMYKARLVRMIDRRQTGTGVLIEEIALTDKSIAPGGG